MAVPPLRQIIEPLLRVLAEAPDGLTARQAQDLVAERLQLTDDDRSIRVAVGTQLLFRHRTNWAHDRLKRARLSSTPRKGVWRLTTEGMKLAATSANELQQTDAFRNIAKAARDMKLPTADDVTSPIAST